MRLVRLAKVAAAAEKLRLRRLVRRQLLRAVYGGVAVVFALALLASLHVAGGIALASWVGPAWAALIVAGVDLVIAAVFGVIAAGNEPDAVEREAMLVSQEARAQMAETAVMATMVAPLARRAGWRIVDRLIGGSRRK
jgi:hypothetical protein